MVQGASTSAFSNEKQEGMAALSQAGVRALKEGLKTGWSGARGCRRTLTWLLRGLGKSVCMCGAGGRREGAEKGRCFLMPKTSTGLEGLKERREPVACGAQIRESEGVR